MLAALLNLGFAGSGETVVVKTTPPGGGHILPPDYPVRKFTRKDEKELKKLLLQVVEEEDLSAQKRAEELARLVDSASGIKRAVDEAEKSIRKQALSQKIQWEEAKRRLEELEEEEDLLLILSL